MIGVFDQIYAQCKYIEELGAKIKYLKLTHIFGFQDSFAKKHHEKLSVIKENVIIIISRPFNIFICHGKQLFFSDFLPVQTTKN